MMLLVMLLTVGVQSKKHKFGGYRLVYTEYSQVFVRFFFFVWCRISAINRTNDTVSLMNTHLLLKNVSNKMFLF